MAENQATGPSPDSPLGDVPSNGVGYPGSVENLPDAERTTEIVKEDAVRFTGPSISKTVLFKRRGVCVFKEPKTENSSRRVEMTPKLALYLASYRAERERLYQQSGEPLTLDSLLFTNAQGKPVDPSVLSHEFARLAKKVGLKNIHFHSLRHTFASLALLRGVSPKVISEMLGHSSVAFTMDVYSHIIDGMKRDAMALLDEVMPAGVVQKNNTDLTHVFQN